MTQGLRLKGRLGRRWGREFEAEKTPRAKAQEAKSITLLPRLSSSSSLIFIELITLHSSLQPMKEVLLLMPVLGKIKPETEVQRC